MDHEEITTRDVVRYYSEWVTKYHVVTQLYKASVVWNEALGSFGSSMHKGSR